MSESSELIERMERETGQRIDDNGGDNNAVAGCLGALARMMGKTAHTNYADDPKMDVSVGIYLKLKNRPEAKARERSLEMVASMLAAGISPDDLKSLKG